MLFFLSSRLQPVCECFTKSGPVLFRSLTFMEALRLNKKSDTDPDRVFIFHGVLGYVALRLGSG